jgi:serine/threonine-protein kinase
MAKVSSVEEAKRIADASRVISVHLLSSADNPRLQLSLIDVRAAEQLNTTHIHLDSSRSTGRATQLAPALADLLDVTLPDSFYEKLAQSEATNSKAADYYERGRQALEEARESGSVSGATDTAIKFFQMARKTDSSFSKAYVGLANAYWLKYRNDGDSLAARRARSFERRAQNLSDQDDPGVYVRRGNLNLLRGHYEQALVDFRFAVGLDSSDVEARLGLARAQENLGLFRQAEQTFHTALKISPDSWRAHNRLGLLYLNRNRPDEAAAQFRAVIADDTSNVTGYLNLGVALRQDGKTEKALKSYQRALSSPSLSPVEHYRAYLNRGTALYFQGKYNEAAQSYERALEIDSSRERIWGNLMYTYQRLDRDSLAGWAAGNAAERTFRRIQLNPNNPQRRAELAGYLAVAGDSTRARNQLREALRLDPKTPDTVFEIGYVYEQVGDRKRAIELIRKAVEGGYPSSKVKERPQLADLIRDPRLKQQVENRSRRSIEEPSITS